MLNDCTDIDYSIFIHLRIKKKKLTAVKTYKHDEFGNTESFGNLDNEIAYTSGIYDKSTQLYYLNTRYYNPDDGRFITQDSYRGTNEDIGTWHLYAYCGNNPVNYVDPSGHKWYQKTIYQTYGKYGSMGFTGFYAGFSVEIVNKKIKRIYPFAKVYKKAWFITIVKGKSGMSYKRSKNEKTAYVRAYWAYTNAFQYTNSKGFGINGYYIMDISLKANREYKAFKGNVLSAAFPIVWGNQDSYRNIYGWKTYESGIIW
ncbi:MAG: RHS repeat-associated core domain-containing protein [Anaerovoracaceae bacterium]